MFFFFFFSSQTSLVVSLFPCYSGSGEFLKTPANPPRSPSDRSIPPSPAAAPAAGGWGIGDPRLVHSVGFVGRLSVALRRRWCDRCGVLAVGLILSDGGAFRSAAVESLPSPSSRMRGFFEFVVPLSGLGVAGETDINLQWLNPSSQMEELMYFFIFYKTLTILDEC